MKKEVKKPNLFIVGNPKSGTTALYAFLKQHPQIYFSKSKEPSFLAKDFHKEIDDFYKNYKKWGRSNLFRYRLKEKYLELFEHAKNEKILADSSTSYLYSKVAANEIKKFNPKAKILIILREPTEFINSLYNNEFGQVEDAPNLKIALSREEDRKKGILTRTVFPPVSFLFYSERVKYAEMVKKYVDIFGKKNVKVIIYEDYRNDNMKTLKEIFEFTGVDPKFKPILSREYVSVNVRFKRLKAWMHLLTTSPAWKKHLRVMLPEFLIKFLDKVYDSVFYSNRKMKKIDPELQLKLKKKYAGEVEKIDKYLHKTGLIKKNINLMKLWNYESFL